MNGFRNVNSDLYYQQLKEINKVIFIHARNLEQPEHII